MINVISKSGNLSGYLKSTTQVVSNQLPNNFVAISLPKSTQAVNAAQSSFNPIDKCQEKKLVTGKVRVSSGPLGKKIIIIT